MAIEAARVLAVYQARRESLRLRMRGSMTALWGRYGGPTDRHVDEFLGAALPVVRAGQAATVTSTDAYLAVTLGKPPVGLDPREHTGAALRNGIDPREVYTRPIITLRAGLSKGASIQAAGHTASARLIATVETDLQLAHRKAAQSVFRERGIRSYRRVTTARSCGLCGSLTGKRYLATGLLPVHGSCDCTVAPIVDGFDPRSAAFEPEETLDPAVHEHGELGPVLAQAGHAFTGPSDLP